MTTIAWKDGVLAADTQRARDGSRLLHNYTKIHTPKPGESWRVNGRKADVMAFSGSVSDIPWVIEALKSEAGITHRTVIESVDPDFEVIIIDESQTAYLFASAKIENKDKHTFYFREEHGAIAIGSGSDFCTAAMYLGKSAAEAVEVACALDLYSGLPVLTWRPKFGVQGYPSEVERVK